MFARDCGSPENKNSPGLTLRDSHSEKYAGISEAGCKFDFRGAKI